MRDFTKIQAWQQADDLTVALYDVTREFPKEELYGLTSQLRRAAYSVAANIVEGSARETQRDYLHFLYIARASLSETRSFIHLATRLKYLTPAEHDRFGDQAIRAAKTLSGLIKAVEAETGKLGRMAARVSSLLLFSFGHLVFRPL